MNITKERIIKSYIDAYNHFDVPVMLKYMHDDVVFKNISSGEVNMELKGIEPLRQQAEKAKNFFSERHQEVVSIIFDGDRAEVEMNYTGTLAVDLPNGMKKGQRLMMKGKSIFVFIDDLIIELTDIS